MRTDGHRLRWTSPCQRYDKKVHCWRGSKVRRDREKRKRCCRRFNIPFFLLVEHEVDAVDGSPDGEAHLVVDCLALVHRGEHVDHVAAHFLAFEQFTKFAGHMVDDGIVVRDQEGQVFEFARHDGALFDVRSNGQ